METGSETHPSAGPQIPATEAARPLERVASAIQQTLQGLDADAMRYMYEGGPRTRVFRRSPLTGWMFAFGFLGERSPGG